MTNKRNLILAAVAVVIIAVVITIIAIPKGRELTELERISLREQSEKIMRYMEEIDITKDGIEPLPEKLSDISYERYIAYAIEYAYGEENKSSLSVSEIKELIESKFDVELDEEKIRTNGITPILFDKNINDATGEDLYAIDRANLTKRDIAAIPIDVYLEKETKADDKNYVITYDKYNIKNPYDAVPYAADGMTGINDYLNGKGKVIAIKQILTRDNAEQLSTFKKNTTVKFGIKNDKIVVLSIK